MTEIVDESRRSILRKEFYMDGLNCDPVSFDKECELTNAHFYKNEKREDIKSHHYIISYVPADVKTENHLTQKELGMASKTKTNNIWWLHSQAPVESITLVLDIR
mgnify:FL=1